MSSYIARGMSMASHSPSSHNEKQEREIPLLGLLTKTFNVSPVARWILPLSLLQPPRQTLAFVGEDFVRICEVTESGHLKHLVTKNDFDCKIFKATTLIREQSVGGTSHLPIKQEHDDFMTDLPQPASHTYHDLILTLSIGELVILSVRDDGDSRFFFECSRTPLPTSADPLQRFGKLLAVERQGRAIAVAAPESGLMLLDMAPRRLNAFEDIDEPGTGFKQTRPLIQIDGIIHRMSFLHPAENDPDHIVLLLVKCMDKKVFVQRIEWLASEGPSTAHVHNAQRIITGGRPPNLLVPLYSDSTFVLTCGSDLYLFTDLLSGHVQQHTVHPQGEEPSTEGESRAERHLWTAYIDSKACAGSIGQTNTWLATAEGRIYELKRQITDTTSQLSMSPVTTLPHRIGEAFAAFSGPSPQESYLVAAEELSGGGLYRMSAVTAYTNDDEVMEDAEYDECYEFEQLEILQNWTPTLDILSSSLPRGHERIARIADSLFTTSGRQPHGQIAELRSGIEARSGLSFSIDELHGCDGIWAVPNGESGVHLLVSYPSLDGRSCARLLSIDHDGVSMIDLSTSDDRSSTLGFDLVHPTITVAVDVAHQITIQITTRTITAPHGNRAAHYDLDLQSDEWIQAADIDLSDPSEPRVLVVIKSGASTIFAQITLTPDGLRSKRLGGSPIVQATSCIKLLSISGHSLVLVATAHGSIHLLETEELDRQTSLLEYNFQSEEAVLASCESIVVRNVDQGATTRESKAQVICGLRNGTLWCLELSLITNANELTASLVQTTSLALGGTSVYITPFRLEAGNHGPRQDAIARCESGLYLVSSPHDSTAITVDPIWITDVNEPSLQQGHITAAIQVPYASSLDTSGFGLSLVTISGSDCVFSTIADTHKKTVPRSLPVRGSPNRLIYSSQLSHFIVSAIESWIDNQNQAHSSPATYSRAVIDFRPAAYSPGEGGSEGCQFLLQAGERVYGLAEWVFRSPENKKYVFILVATGIEKHGGLQKGRVHMLQPSLKDGKIHNIVLANTTKFDAPVYALTLQGDRDYLACSGSWLHYLQYSVAKKKWIERTKYKLPSPAVHITMDEHDGELIHVTTAADSSMTFVKAGFADFDLEEATMSAIPEEARLIPNGSDDRPNPGLYHLALFTSLNKTTSVLPSIHDFRDRPLEYEINLMSTKGAQVRGVTSRQKIAPNGLATSPCVFHAQLSRSLTRMTIQNLSPVSNQPSNRIVGTSTDGTITGLKILDKDSWAKLQWVQTLCKRNATICPFLTKYSRKYGHGHTSSAGSIPPMGYAGYDRYADELETDYEARTGVPYVAPSLSARITSEMDRDPQAMDMDLDIDIDTDTEMEKRRYIAAVRYRPEDMHINADLLQRFLERGGATLLKTMLEDEARRPGSERDRIGVYIATYLEREVAGAEKAMGEVKEVLGWWDLKS